MLDDALKAQLKGYLENLRADIELAASLDDGDASAELLRLLQGIASLSPRIQVRRTDEDARRPAFAIRRPGTDIEVRFAGVPLGHEFSSLVLALLQVSGHPPRADDAVLRRIRALDGELHFETYYSLSCQNCPDVVQALNLMSIVNPRIRHVAIDGAVFRDEVEQRQVMAVPSVFLNGEPFAQGRMDLPQLLAKLDSNPAPSAAQSLADKPVFDVLVVGGGPAGAAAAIYAARKGIRTGLLAERIGGQVQDTMAIENFISVLHTEGPAMARALSGHLQVYDVDVMTGQRVERLIPAREPGGTIQVQLANGDRVAARSVVLATGARWRTMNVPGEEEYRNRGVAFCPHCDGPLFKNKNVAVIGGGNSGVEAAIDLAGTARQVTLLEFDQRLRADAVLQERLRALPNVSVHLNAQTTAVVGDGRKVTALQWRDRGSNQSHQRALDGVFVQIGLVPGTEFLQDQLELSPRGEIVIDARGATSLPGVFAAGDATTVPYKQIVIAMGAGATAALSAFEYLVRTVRIPDARPRQAA